MRVSNRNVVVATLLGVFLLISFYLYGSLDNSTALRRQDMLRHKDEVRHLRDQVQDLEGKLRENAQLMRKLQDDLKRSEFKNPRSQNDYKKKPAVDSDKADAAMEQSIDDDAKAEEQSNNQQAQAQIPAGNKVEKVHRSLTKSASRQQCALMANYSNAETNVQMLDIYEILPFDNPDGGVWKQGWPITYDEAKVKTEKKLEVIVIPHSHCDPGWIMTFEEYYSERTRKILDGMAKHLGEKPDMRFIYAEMSFFEMWWAQQKEPVREQVRKYLDSGKLEIVTGGWVMTDEANAHYHSIIMELFEGHEFISNHISKDYKPRSHWSIDPFGLSPSIPLLLSEANITNAALQRVHYSVKKKLAEMKHLEFMWRQLGDGKDSRRDVRSHMFPFYSYDTPHTCGPEPKVCCQFDFKRLPGGGLHCDWGVPPVAINSGNVAQRAFMIYDQYRKKSQLYKTNVVLIPLGDDFRYQDDFDWNSQHDNYQKLFEYMNSKTEWNVHARFGTLSDYFDALDKTLKEDNEKLPVLSGDFFTYADRDDHYWSGYFTSRPFYKQMDRVLQHYLRTAEITHSLARMQGLTLAKSVMPKLVSARRALSLFQHHDGVTGTAKDPVVIDYGNKMLAALSDCETVIGASVGALLAGSATSTPSLTLDESRSAHDALPDLKNFDVGKNLILFNSLAQKRSQVVCIRVGTSAARIMKLDGTIPEQQISPVLEAADDHIRAVSGKYEVCFFAEVQPLSSETFTVFSKTGQTNKELTSLKGSAKPAGLDQFFDFGQSAGDFELSNGVVSGFFSGVTGLLREVTLNTGDRLTVNSHFVKYGARGHGHIQNGGGDNLSGAYVFLPDGDAKKLEITSPAYAYIDGPIVKKLLIIGPHDGKLLQEYTLEKGSNSIGIQNTIDLRGRSDNVEIAMRFETQIKSEYDLFTDLNGLQIIKRKRMLEKLPLQAHFYPMPGSAYIEDSKLRLTLIGSQALGVASLQSGLLEVMLDRRLQQDDNRGLFQPLLDNRVTVSHFRLLIEPVSPLPEQLVSSPLGHLSSVAHHESLQLHYPWVKLQSSGEPPSTKVQGISTSLPCDAHLVSLRTSAGPTNYEGNREVEPQREVALVLHRWVADCRSARSIDETSCSASSRVDVSSLFSGVKSAHPASLTLLYKNSTPITSVELEPEHVRTIRLVF